MKSKKNKDEKKFDENNTYNNVEKSLKTDPRNDKQQQNVETPLILRTPAPTPFVETPIIPTDEEEEEDFCYDSTSPEVSRSNSKNTPDNRSSKSSDKISLVSVPSTATTSNEENVKIQPKNQISRQQAFINFCRYLLFLSEGKKQLQKLFIKIWNVYAQLAKEKTEKWKDDETQKAQLERLMLTKQCDQKYRENVKKNKTEEWDITTLFNAIRSVNSFVKKPYQLKEFNEVDNLNSIRNQTFHGRFGYTPAEFETKKNELVDCLRKLGMTMEVIEIIKHHSQNIIYVGEASEQKSTPKKSVTQEITTKSKSFNKPQFDSTAEMFGKRTEVNALGGSLCGLANPGSLCYMNVILQSLFALTAFRRIILKANVQNVVVKALQKLFIKMQFGQIQCDSYDIFVSSKWSEEKDSAGQQDIEEFLTSFIKEIEEALIPVGLDNELQNLLRGYTCNYTESTPTIHVLRLNLFSSDQSIIKNIYPALKQYYETQRHDVDAPPILCMYLLRTNYYNDRGTVKTVKINDNIDFPKVLDMNEYMAQPEDDNVDNTKNKIDDYTYVLQSIVTHAGTASTGHYTVFINYKPTVSDLWYLFDDSNVHVFNEKCLFKGDTFLQQGSFTPCMFFYVKKSSIREVTSPSPRICNIAPSLKKELQQQQFNIKIKFYQYTGGKTFPQNAPAKTHETELTLLEILERKQEWLYERAAVYFGVEIDQFNLKAIVDNETALPSFDVVCRSRPIAELCSGKVIHIIVQCP
uniref:Ubiquitin carboxyl-terminal hydrolase n=1 Tax=Panagrolaimus davidi TaxID=227884 RepID=A0A914RCZ0_9BILA